MEEFQEQQAGIQDKQIANPATPDLTGIDVQAAAGLEIAGILDGLPVVPDLTGVDIQPVGLGIAGLSKFPGATPDLTDIDDRADGLGISGLHGSLPETPDTQDSISEIPVLSGLESQPFCGNNGTGNKQMVQSDFAASSGTIGAMGLFTTPAHHKISPLHFSDYVDATYRIYPDDFTTTENDRLSIVSAGSYDAQLSQNKNSLSVPAMLQAEPPVVYPLPIRKARETGTHTGKTREQPYQNLPAHIGQWVGCETQRALTGRPADPMRAFIKYLPNLTEHTGIIVTGAKQIADDARDLIHGTKIPGEAAFITTETQYEPTPEQVNAIKEAVYDENYPEAPPLNTTAIRNIVLDPSFQLPRPPPDDLDAQSTWEIISRLNPSDGDLAALSLPQIFALARSASDDQRKRSPYLQQAELAAAASSYPVIALEKHIDSNTADFVPEADQWVALACARPDAEIYTCGEQDRETQELIQRILRSNQGNQWGKGPLMDFKRRTEAELASHADLIAALWQGKVHHKLIEQKTYTSISHTPLPPGRATSAELADISHTNLAVLMFRAAVLAHHHRHEGKNLYPYDWLWIMMNELPHFLQPTSCILRTEWPILEEFRDADGRPRMRFRQDIPPAPKPQLIPIPLEDLVSGIQRALAQVVVKVQEKIKRLKEEGRRLEERRSIFFSECNESV